MPNASNLHIQHEEYKVLGSSRVGAPYRNPIAGYRKTLACCCKSNQGSQPCYKGCIGACYIELALQNAKQFKTPRPMRNDYIYLSDGEFFGYVTDLPSENQEIETESKTSVVKVRLENGTNTILPRTNVELIK